MEEAILRNCVASKWATLLCCLAGFPPGCQPGVRDETVGVASSRIIYGADDRCEAYEYPDRKWTEQTAGFSVAIMSADELDESDPANVRILARSLGDRYGLCSDESFLSQPTAATCSGTLIAPELVLTVGHCLEPSACSQARFVFGYAMASSQQVAPLTADDVFGCAEVTIRSVGAAEYEVIKLDRPALGRTPARVRAVDAPVQLGESLVFTGYPSGLPRKIAGGAQVRDARADQLDFFRSNLDSFPGSSGSGVFLESTGELVGMVVRGPKGRGDGYVQLAGESCARPERVSDDRAEWIESVYAANAIQALCELGKPPELCPCGNGSCEGDRWESSVTCPEDCGSVCGDGVCNAKETGATCYAECGACGNAICEPFEVSHLSCCKDCGCPGAFDCREGACVPATGNVNGDDAVDAEDFELVERWVMRTGLRPFHDDVADVDCNGQVDVQDRETLAELVRGDIRELPCDSVVDVATGGKHTCILLGSGRVRCWGDDTWAQLGHGSSSDLGYEESAARAAETRLEFRAKGLAAGAAHTCALSDDGRVKCWGKGSSGELGNATTATIGDDEPPSAGAFVGLSERAKAIAAGGSHTCALLDSGDVQCWGSNGMGQLGLGTTGNVGDDELPSTVDPLRFEREAVQVAAGMNHTCVLLSDGQVRCWGANGSGQLGLGHKRNIGDDERPNAEPPVSLGGPARALVAGGLNSCAILESGSLLCWGENAARQLGYGHTLRVGDDELPSAIGAVPVGASVAEVTVGNLRTCARLDNGRVHCWGMNALGQLGYGNTRSMPPGQSAAMQGEVDLGGTVQRLESGVDHTCALLSGGSLVCWGANLRGQLGYGHTGSIGDDELPASAGAVPRAVAPVAWRFENPYGLQVSLRVAPIGDRGSRIDLVVRNPKSAPLKDLVALYLMSALETPERAVVFEDTYTPNSTPLMDGACARPWCLSFNFARLELDEDWRMAECDRGAERVSVFFSDHADGWDTRNDYSAAAQPHRGEWHRSERVQVLTSHGELVYGWTRD